MGARWRNPEWPDAMIPFADFAPDRSDFDATASDTILNVIPQAESYGPFPAFVAITDALPAKPLGAILAPYAGSYVAFAGTVDKLYQLDTANLDWDDVSQAATTYAVPSGDAWSFVQYGDLVIAADKVDATQKFNLASPATFVDLAGTPPKSKYLGVIGDFLQALDTESSEREARWSGLNAPEQWTAGEQASDAQQFPDGGPIMGFAGFERGGVIFQETCIREQALALDSPLIFTMQKTVSDKGCVAPRSIVNTGDGVFYLSQLGFCQYGLPPTRIGESRVDDFFLNDVDLAFIDQVQGIADPNRNIVAWRYKSRAHVDEDTTDRVLIYNYSRSRWSIAHVELSWLLPVASPGYTLESLDDLGFTLDTLPFSLDSRAWASGAPVLGGFDASYRLGFFSGAPMEAMLQTGDIEFNPGRRSFVSGWRPIIDGGTVSGRVAVKSTHQAPRTWLASASSQTTGIIPARAEGRLHRFELTIEADGSWSHVHGIDAAPRQTGYR